MTKKTSNKISVSFQPDGVTTTAEIGANLLETAMAAGVHIRAACGGAGTCGTCKVHIEKGEVESKRTAMVTKEEYAAGVRQACQCRLMTDLTVRVPVESRLEAAVIEQEMNTEGVPEQMLVSGWEFKPPVNKILLEMTPPTLKNNSSDLTRLRQGLRQNGYRHVAIDINMVRKLPAILRKGKWTVTATILHDSESGLTLTALEPCDTRNHLYGLAFDIGTTGLRGQLLDLNRGQVLADGLDYNKQIGYGADVISRIACCGKKNGLKNLQKAAVATMNGIISDITARAGVKTKDIAFMTVAANTTMVHLLLGLDPKYLRLAPYVPAAGAPPVVAAKSLGIKLPPKAMLYALPSVASYVGGDIVAGIMGTGIQRSEKMTLYIDIGTNGEIAIGNADWMMTASASAGPAFEGGGIKHGMIATEGAIEDFDINTQTCEPKISTIGNAKPKGICGAGLINIAASLLKAGLISRKGKFQSHLKTKRVRQGTDGVEYVVAEAKETATGKDIVLTEVDIDNLIRAKAAMYAACQTLIKSVGATCGEVEQVIIAGTFGSHIDIERGITIGLLPDLPRERFTFIGNGSLLGARLTAFSTELMDEGRKIANMMTNIELSENNDFMDNYVAALFLPHTDINQFPSVKAGLSAIKQGAGL